MQPANEITLSDNPARLDHDVIWAFISQAYWARTRTREQHARALAHSLCIGAYAAGAQAGFARVVTDYALTAHIADVFVLPPYRGHGLGKRLVRAVLEHPELAQVGRFTLNTSDAHGLYAQFGFGPLAHSHVMMELRR